MPKVQVPYEYVSKLSRADQINELNSEVRCKLGVSSVHGVGVIALRDINKGDRCYCTPRVIPKFYNIPYGSLSKLFPYVRELVLERWASVVNGSIFQSPNDDAGLIFFMNHSREPNYDIVKDEALRAIKVGEELFEDYRFMDNAHKVYDFL